MLAPAADAPTEAEARVTAGAAGDLRHAPARHRPRLLWLQGAQLLAPGAAAHAGAAARHAECLCRARAGRPWEARALLRDLLISVTAFFRDHESFAALMETVMPRLFEGKGADDAVRVWVPGCATGEEAYSVAMLLREYATSRKATPRLQVFATDIDEHALGIARLGHYPAAGFDAVLPERLERFFQREGAGRTVTREIRDICVFSAHSIIRDPPFSRLDLISCRNLLIYLDATTRRISSRCSTSRSARVASSSSAVRERKLRSPTLFAAIDRHHRICAGTTHAGLPHAAAAASLDASRMSCRAPRSRRPARAVREADTAIREGFAPPHVVVNAEGDIIHFSGRTGDYLEAAAGQPTSNLWRSRGVASGWSCGQPCMRPSGRGAASPPQSRPVGRRAASRW